MKVELNKQELEIIECMASGWDSNELVDQSSGLYGGLSRKMAYDLLKKLKLEIPKNLAMLCEKEDEYIERFERKL